MLTIRVNPARDNTAHAVTPDIEPDALVAFLDGVCVPGDKVQAEYVSRAGKRVVSHVWPFGDDVAKDMVGDEDGSKLGQHSEMRTHYRNTRWGVFGYKKVVGPPMWKLPRVVPVLRRGDGSPFLAFQIGWRFTLHSLMWLVKRDGGGSVPAESPGAGATKASERRTSI